MEMRYIEKINLIGPPRSTIVMQTTLWTSHKPNEEYTEAELIQYKPCYIAYS